MTNTAFILTLAYPETIVSHATEWYSPYLKYVGIGNKTKVRAGHAALVLVNKKTGVLEYHDFGRYVTTEPHGRVRGRHTDNELHFPLVAQIENNKISNLNTILSFLATHPKLTHGEGRLVASVCDKIEYEKARAYITMVQNRGFMYYAAFKKEASNCARFVTDGLIASVTDVKMRINLKKSKWFTPSTVSNVLLANTGAYSYEVTAEGVVSEYKGTPLSENFICFLDRLKGYQPNDVGTLQPGNVEGLHENAQWLSGIGAGAWYELHKTEKPKEFIGRRISPYGHIDCDALFISQENDFNYEQGYDIMHDSNCQFFHVRQNNKRYLFKRELS
ncbi:hypothetical protein N7U66_15900 [Lacinutrix neustonica]|uniref:Uncharacterized protein n=1 Tax=Lacinutrix neustonica TaxID=2980107 RepID=A0A9E8MTZ0_9FLAO|nr:DUF6695 family protein [Lacinutrix neustonica]WAC01477.1 hypothetical protein N7U66_15900 [Lacinutrix neustonica]